LIEVDEEELKSDMGSLLLLQEYLFQCRTFFRFFGDLLRAKKSGKKERFLSSTFWKQTLRLADPDVRR
jgi:hypothetical protein